MKAAVYSFTRRGAKLSVLIGNELEKMNFSTRCLTMAKFAEEDSKLEIMENHNESCKKDFIDCQLLVFVGATGIAVRTIAPYVKSKIVDPAVLSIDEGCSFVVPLLSGHIGGGNAFARALAQTLGAVPVVTTATDINNLFAIDEWAKRNRMIISSLHAAKIFAAELVDGKTVGLATKYPIVSALPTQVVQTLEPRVGMAITDKKDFLPFETTVQLRPQNLYLGIGCRRGTELEIIESLVLPNLKNLDIDIQTIAGIASIDLKKDEQGLLKFAEKYDLPIKFYSKEELQEVVGEFSSSPFVASVVGVDNVCERSAKLLSKNGRTILPKTSLNGVTLSIAEETIVLDFEKL